MDRERPVTLVGGAPVDRADLVWALSHAPHLAAADGGAETILNFGHRPEAVIGDMDSLSDAVLSTLPQDILHHIAEQDSTDFEKCLTRIRAPFVIGLGFVGARLDHTLAALSCLSRLRARCVLLGPRDVVFAAPRDMHLDLAPGTRVSLFPMERVMGHSDGLRWPIDGVQLAPGGLVGTSNEATGPVRLAAEGILVMLPRTARDAAVTVFA